MAFRLFVALSLISLAIAPPNAFAETPLVVANNRFALDLYRQLAAQPGNVVFSPLSVGTALSMASAGARGSTAEQFEKLLHHGMSPSEAAAAWAALTTGLQPRLNRASAGYELAIANGMWAQSGFSLNPDYRELIAGVYRAPLEMANFRESSGALAAVKAINAWAVEQTKGKIKDLFAPRDFDADTRLVLANAVYFQGNWEQSFPKTRTSDGGFHLRGGREVSVPMMHHLSRFAHAQNDEVQALELPYRDSQLSMVIVLPKEREAMTELEKALTEEKLRKWLHELKQKRVWVAIPRFRFSFAQRLDKPLQDLGLTDAFSPQAADFAGIAENEDLFISMVQHQAFIEVNEEGTEAAAATAGVASATSAPPTFIADHPFLFLIRDRESGAILFLGRVANPLE
jgi:serpin B